MKQAKSYVLGEFEFELDELDADEGFEVIQEAEEFYTIQNPKRPKKDMLYIAS